jgi:hypothetical protein
LLVVPLPQSLRGQLIALGQLIHPLSHRFVHCSELPGLSADPQTDRLTSPMRPHPARLDGEGDWQATAGPVPQFPSLPNCRPFDGSWEERGIGAFAN